MTTVRGGDGDAVDYHALLTIKQLAGALGRTREYISAMKRRGFTMPAGRATLAEARAWLARNPAPRARRRFDAAAA